MSESIPPHDNCPGDHALHDYLSSGVSPPDADRADRSALSRHIESCPRCRARAETFRQDDDLVAALADAHAARPLDARDPDGQPAPTTPPVVPGYEIVSEIHRGGQGIVFRAIQTATKRTVALKVLLRGGFASVRQQRRFEREVDLVAGLRHPNIVTLYDSGVSSDDSLYFAMEFIDGRPLDEYMRSRRDAESRGRRRSVDDTLRLFSRICGAVAYAHQHGVIHRDLKPANVCVDDAGEPHVLDFGLARPTGDGPSSRMTLTGEFMGTLAYASPEQTRGDPALIDVRSDVYALGVILYEMLTGRLPYPVTGSLAEALRAIAESDPEPPSAWYHRHTTDNTPVASAPCRVNDEIETIVLKALAKEKPRRYQTVEHFRQDIEHYLAGEPIDAKRDSTWYVMQKTVRRHKVPVSAAAGFIMLVVGFLAYHANAMARERDVARSATEHFVRMIERGNPAETAESDFTVVAMLDEDVDALRQAPPAQPEAEARVRHAIGNAYKENGQYAKARVQLARALELRRRLHDEPAVELVQNLNDLGSAVYKLGDYPAAERLFTEALEMSRELDAPADLSESYNNLATVRQRQSRFAEAEQMFREAIAVRREFPDIDDPTKIAPRMNLATWLREQGRYGEAEEFYRESLANHRDRLAPDHLQTAKVKTALARCLTRLGRFDEAATLLDEALAVKTRLPNPRHPTVAISLLYRAELALAQDDDLAAERDSQDALAIFREVLPAGHRRTAEALVLLGSIRIARGDAASAEPLLRQAADMAETALGPDHYLVDDARSVLGQCLTDLGRLDEAEPLLVKSYPRLREKLGPQHDRTQAALDRIVRFYESSGSPDKADPYLALRDGAD